MNRREFLKSAGYDLFGIAFASAKSAPQEFMPTKETDTTKSSDTERKSVSNKAYLKTLKIVEGQFSSEKAVRLVDYSGKETSGFFENEHLIIDVGVSSERSVKLRDYNEDEIPGFFENGRIRDGSLEVIIVSEEKDSVLVKLPGRTLEAPGDKGYFWVRKGDLKYAA